MIRRRPAKIKNFGRRHRTSFYVLLLITLCFIVCPPQNYSEICPRSGGRCRCQIVGRGAAASRNHLPTRSHRPFPRPTHTHTLLVHHAEGQEAGPPRGCRDPGVHHQPAQAPAWRVRFAAGEACGAFFRRAVCLCVVCGGCVCACAWRVWQARSGGGGGGKCHPFVQWPPGGGACRVRVCAAAPVAARAECRGAWLCARGRPPVVVARAPSMGGGAARRCCVAVVAWPGLGPVPVPVRNACVWRPWCCAAVEGGGGMRDASCACGQCVCAFAVVAAVARRLVGR